MNIERHPAHTSYQQKKGQQGKKVEGGKGLIQILIEDHKRAFGDKGPMETALGSFVLTMTYLSLGLQLVGEIANHKIVKTLDKIDERYRKN